MMQTTRIRRLDRLARSADTEVPLRIIFDWGDGDELTPLQRRNIKRSGASTAGEAVANRSQAIPERDGTPA